MEDQVWLSNPSDSDWLLTDQGKKTSDSSGEEDPNCCTEINDPLLLGVTSDLRKEPFSKFGSSRKKRKRTAYASTKPKKYRRKNTTGIPTELTPERERLLQKATNAYIEHDIPRALRLLEELIRIAPGLHDPFHLLGLIHEEELKDPRKAVDYYMVAAHMVPGDTDLWKRIAKMSAQMGSIRQAIYCYRRCLRDSSGNLDETVAFQVAASYLKLNEHKRAAAHYRSVYEKNKDDISLCREAARCYYIGNDLASSADVLALHVQEAIESFVALSGEDAENANLSRIPLLFEREDGTNSDVGKIGINAGILNMLCEILVEMSDYSKCYELLHTLCKNRESTLIHIDIIVKLAAAEIVLNKERIVSTAEEKLEAVCAPQYIGSSTAVATVSSSSERTSSMSNTGKGFTSVSDSRNNCSYSKDRRNGSNSNSTDGGSANHSSNELYADLYIALGDAYYHRHLFRKSIYWYCKCEPFERLRTHVKMWFRAAESYMELGQLEDAAVTLQRCIAANDATGRCAGIRDAELRLLLCTVLRQLGRPHDADQVLLSVQYKDLRDAELIPIPIKQADRLRYIEKLNTDLYYFSVNTTPMFDAAVKAYMPGFVPDSLYVPMSPPPPSYLTPSSPPHNCSTSWAGLRAVPSAALVEFVSAFFALVRDSELDTQRVFRQSYQRRIKILQNMRQEDPVDTESIFAKPFLPSNKSTFQIKDIVPSNGSGGLVRMVDQKYKKKDPTKSIWHIKIRQELGISSLEDILGWLSYGRLLERCMVVLRYVRKFKEGAELIETILSNKRQDRTNAFQLNKAVFRLLLRRICFVLSVEGDIYRLSLCQTRSQFVLHSSDSRSLVYLAKLVFSSRLSHHALRALSSSAEKQMLLEVRSWCVRHLLNNPKHFKLVMLVAHYCALTGRCAFAVGEYARAHRLRPKATLPLLCLAVATLTFATSRIVQDTNQVVLRGMAMLTNYMEARMKEAEEEEGTLCEFYGQQGNPSGQCTQRDEAPYWIVINHTKWTKIELYRAECIYNLARSYHTLGLLYLAVPLYMKTLSLLQGE